MENYNEAMKKAEKIMEVNEKLIVNQAEQIKLLMEQIEIYRKIIKITNSSLI